MDLKHIYEIKIYNVRNFFSYLMCDITNIILWKHNIKSNKQTPHTGLNKSSDQFWYQDLKESKIKLNTIIYISNNVSI